ncbi:ATP-binding protein [Streptomyces armeniacus]|uniref:ATP-binding protein n=1 Tax=Streptomyces armeniacus TaxID=83291 RepID=A0A345XW62_9ACTN|nr:ATP-binding protein [Streptomyces armeniacus]AXK35878.1 ATP-binding protein [Streptomyces armeniacus]
MTCTTDVAPASSTSGEAGVIGFEMNFLPAEVQVGHMRWFTARHLNRWGLGHFADDAALAVSELVTNAVRHGGGRPVGFRVTCSDQELRIEVSDGNPAPAHVCSAVRTEESGRGLLLVEAVTDSWGVSPDGTTTWCAFSISQGRS